MQKLQELKFYCLLTIRREPDYDEEYDYSEEYPEISPFAVAGCADAVQKRLEAYCSDDGKRGLMEYYDREKSVSEKVYSAVPSVTVRNGELMGMYTCQIHGELNCMELDELRDYLTGQSSDDAHEGFEQREIKTAEYGNIYISFWNDSDEWSLLTEEELEQQEMEESMDMRL